MASLSGEFHANSNLQQLREAIQECITAYQRHKQGLKTAGGHEKCAAGTPEKAMDDFCKALQTVIDNPQQQGPDINYCRLKPEVIAPLSKAYNELQALLKGLSARPVQTTMADILAFRDGSCKAMLNAMVAGSAGPTGTKSKAPNVLEERSKARRQQHDAWFAAIMGPKPRKTRKKPAKQHKTQEQIEEANKQFHRKCKEALARLEAYRPASPRERNTAPEDPDEDKDPYGLGEVDFGF